MPVNKRLSELKALKKETFKKSPKKDVFEERQKEISATLGRLEAETQPFLERGGALAEAGAETYQQGLQQYQDILADPSSVLQSAPFLAQLGMGQQAIETSAAARGMQLSGGTLEELQTFGQTLGAEEIERQLGRAGGLMQIGMGREQLGLQTGMGALQFMGGAEMQALGMGTELELSRLQMQLAQQQAAAQRRASSNQAMMGLLGTIGGAAIGGPMGAAIGGQIGSTVGAQTQPTSDYSGYDVPPTNLG